MKTKDIPNNPQVERLIQLAIDEDIAAGDITSALTVPSEHSSTVEIIARESLVVCGLPLIEKIFGRLESSATAELCCAEGDRLSAGSAIGRLSGKTQDLMAAERVILNFLQRLCGIATYARSVVEAVPGMMVLDTRKTLPGWRMLDKYAVAVGGAENHRLHLGDMILVKDNHIDASGKPLPTVLAEVMANKPDGMLVEIEVRNQHELECALAVKPDAIMLDNMDHKQIIAALQLAAERSPQTRIEVSGGVSKDSLKELQEIGVYCVSMGELTNSVHSVDISMRIV